jgi:hypothetical protein
MAAAAARFTGPLADGGGSYSAPKVFAKNAPSSFTLHLGVYDVPYSDEHGKGKTTGDVAEILEDKYGVMDAFAFAHLPDIAKELEDSIAGSLETLMMGGRPDPNPFAKAESAITAMFKNFLATSAIEHLGIEGVPTLAALNGVNHRLKHPYAKGNSRRPSFIDTGLYSANFTAWFS